MKKMIMACVALVSAVLLSASVASAGKPAEKPVNAKDQVAKQCAALKKADKAAFKSLYGPKKAMRTCIKGEIDETRDEIRNAAQECKAERDDDPALFEETYGSNKPNFKNAYGKCVSSKVKAEDSEDTAEFKNAAKECKAERAEDPEGFKETYGTAKSKGKNALGKCVSHHVKGEDEETA